MSILAILEVLAKVAWLMAKIGTGAASAFCGYQPNLPTALISQK